MTDDTVGTGSVVAPPARIVRRPMDFAPRPPRQEISEDSRPPRKLLIYVGDMVQVIDPKSNLAGKFGLVEEIHPREPDRQVVVKIGKMSNPLRFHQLKFCTRIDRDLRPVARVEDDEISPRISDFIDEVEVDDNIGNRAGANAIHR